MNNCDYQIIIRTIDESLSNLGVSGIVDARKARDQLLDLRNLCVMLDDYSTKEKEVESV